MPMPETVTLTVPLWAVGLLVTVGGALLSGVFYVVGRLFDHDKRLALGSQMFEQVRDRLHRIETSPSDFRVVAQELRELNHHLREDKT